MNPDPSSSMRVIATALVPKLGSLLILPGSKALLTKKMSEISRFLGSEQVNARRKGQSKVPSNGQPSYPQYHDDQ